MGLLDFIFGNTKPKYPIVTNDMVQPADVPITTAAAKRALKTFLREIGYCDGATEANMEANCFADDVNQHEEKLKWEVEQAEADYRGNIAYWNEELDLIKDGLDDADTPTERAEIKEEIDTHKASKPADAELVEAKKRLADFRADKRAFLISYLNEQLHGTST